MEPHDVRAVRLLCEELEKSYAVSSALSDDGAMAQRGCPPLTIRPLGDGKIIVGFYSGKPVCGDNDEPIHFTSFSEAIDALRSDVVTARARAISEHQEKLRKAAEAHNANEE